MTSSRPVESPVVWSPLPGSQALAISCPCDEILYHGTRGPGKTEAQLAYFVARCGLGYGHHWTGIIFDRGYKNLDDLIAKSLVLIPKVFPKAQFLSAKSDLCWKFPTGEKLLFRHMKTAKDYRQYHGHEYPFIGWNELTSFPTSELYDLMKSCNRSSFIPEEHSPALTPEDKRIIEECRLLGEPLPQKVKDKILPDLPLVTFSTTNPHGPGHAWVNKKFIIPAPPGKPVKTTSRVFNPRTGKDEDIITSQVAIFGSYKENRFLDPKYVAFLNSIKDPNKRRAWLGGCWDITSGGALDDLWQPAKAVLPRFPVPAGWKVTRSFDWGSSHPFSVGFWAIANGEEITLPGGRRFCPPARSLVRIGEVYGAELAKTPDGRLRPAYGTNKGLRLSAREVARRIKEAEEELQRGGWIQGAPSPGPADGQIYAVNEDESGSIAQLMAAEGVEWYAADKSKGTRKNGLEMVRVALENTNQGEGPGLYIMDNCESFLETVPTIPRDEDDPDDVDTTAEDHCFIAGTMVQTPRGEVSIESLRPGDEVNTRLGPRPVVMNHKNPGQVYRVKLSNGKELIGTGNHPVFANGDFKRIDLLTKGDTLTEWQKSFQKPPKNFLGCVITFAEGIFNGRGSDFIGRCGSITGGQSPRVTTFTTKTVIPATTGLGIFSCFMVQPTFPFMGPTALTNKGKPRGGMPNMPPKATAKCQKQSGGQLRGRLGQIAKSTRSVVGNVVAGLKAMSRSLLNFVPAGAKQGPTVVSVTFDGPAEVFNLTVSGCHEYFANGVLVHNCYDEVRYMVLDDKPAFTAAVDIDLAM